MIFLESLKKDLGKAKNSCLIVSNLLKDVKHDRVIVGRAVNIVNTGKALLLDIQKLPNYKSKDIEESSLFQNYSNCLLNLEFELETFNRLNSPTDEVCIWYLGMLRHNAYVIDQFFELKNFFFPYRSNKEFQN